MENQFRSYEKLPSGKSITRTPDKDGLLGTETHGYGLLEIAIKYEFDKGVKIDEVYFAKKRMVSRRSYEKARINYPDMPPADAAVADLGSALLREIRAQQRQKRAEREQRLAESEESRFPRPESTNWLRVIAGEKAHLVVFASRDWKVLSKESTIRTGREWMQVFGFHGPPGSKVNVAKGFEIGFEVPGDRDKMLAVSKSLLQEVVNYVNHPPERTYWQSSIRPRPKRTRREPALAWPMVLLPLIEFLSGLTEPHVKIFNHHQ